MQDKTKFAYATGRIRALERHLVPQEIIARMAEAPSFESAFSLLNETIYGPALAKLQPAFEVDELMHFEIEKTIALLNQLAPQNETLRMLFMQYLIHNVKVFIHAQRSKIKPPKKALYNVYPEETNHIRNSILKTQEKLYSDLDELIELLQKNPDSAKIDAQADLWYLEKLLKYAQTSHLTLLIKIAQIKLKIAKLKIDQSPNFEVERLLEDQIMEEIKKAKYIAFGVEPLIAFYFAKLYETNNIVLVLKCKKNEIPKHEINQHVREMYV